MITIQNLKEQMKGYTLEITDLNILTGDIFGIYIDDLECKERLINLISLLEIPSKGNIKIGGIDTNDKRIQECNDKRNQRWQHKDRKISFH